MIKAENGKCAVEGFQNVLFVEMATIIHGIRERLGKEETEEFVKGAFLLSEQGIEAIRVANTIVEFFGEIKKQGDN